MIKTLLILIAFLTLAQPAWAATQGIKISPVSFDLTGLPGQKIENVVKVSNPSDQEIGVEATIYDFVPQGEDGGVEIATDSKFGLAKYLEVFPKSFALKPGELQFVTVTVSLPKDIPAGARSGMVAFGSSSLALSGSGSVVSGQVGALFSLNILGDLKDQAAVLSFTAPPLVPAGPIELSARVKNTGATLAKFSGSLNIHNLLGAKVASLEVGPNNILPDAVRKFDATYNERNPFGIYRAELNGKFGQTPLTAVVYFVGIAPSVTGPLLIFTLTALVLVLSRRKRSV